MNGCQVGSVQLGTNCSFCFGLWTQGYLEYLNRRQDWLSFRFLKAVGVGLCRKQAGRRECGVTDRGSWTLLGGPAAAHLSLPARPEIGLGNPCRRASSEPDEISF